MRENVCKLGQDADWLISYFPIPIRMLRMMMMMMIVMRMMMLMVMLTMIGIMAFFSSPSLHSDAS